MLRRFKWGVLSLALVLALLATTVDARQRSQSLTMATVNDSQWEAQRKPSASFLVKLQVLLDRAHASPGEIDGNLGENTRKAIAAFREMKALEPNEHVDEQLWRLLSENDSEAALVTYKITDKDTAGPFSKKIPEDFRKKAAMERLGYTSPEELLAEKFHMSQELLRKLNPGASFDEAEQEIVVANVEREALPRKISRIEVDADKQRVKAYDKDNNIVAVYPATVGSEDRPTPKGEFKVTDIAENPVYHYDPALHLRGVHVEEKLNIPPGPNNPVGAVWINLSAEGYGIHGTPDPDKISKAASHGCIRLTNWDALELARHVSKGTPVVIGEGEKTGELQLPSQGSQQMGLSLVATDVTPLPERNPARTGAPPQQTPPPPGEVATLPWTETEITVAKAECAEALSSATLDYEALPPIKEGLCGAPAPILLKSLGSDPKVAIDPPATVTCALAKALSAWLNETVQPEANALFHSPVVKLYAASYACRNRNGGADQPLSEHALANAVDISDFVLASGEQIAVVESWPNGPATPPLPLPNPGRLSSETFKMQRVSVSSVDRERDFLKFVHDEACKTFGTVLGPNADEAHKNHFHVDMKERRGASFCQ
jgi:peptidoglycan hydrolase-like protein with peptidoglycan-binding domain